jgi:hypothetical protein
MYKVQRRINRMPTLTEESPSPQGSQRESSPVQSVLLQGILTVLLDTVEEVVFAVWHPEPPIPCPECNKAVKHWDICLHCNRALADECNCPSESTAFTDGFTLRELVRGMGL